MQDLKSETSTYEELKEVLDLLLYNTENGELNIPYLCNQIYKYYRRTSKFDWGSDNEAHKASKTLTVIRDWMETVLLEYKNNPRYKKVRVPILFVDKYFSEKGIPSSIIVDDVYKLIYDDKGRI